MKRDEAMLDLLTVRYAETEQYPTIHNIKIKTRKHSKSLPWTVNNSSLNFTFTQFKKSDPNSALYQHSCFNEITSMNQRQILMNTDGSKSEKCLGSTVVSDDQTAVSSY